MSPTAALEFVGKKKRKIQQKKKLLGGCRADVVGLKSDGEGGVGGRQGRAGGEGLVILALALQPCAHLTPSEPSSLCFFDFD